MGHESLFNFCPQCGTPRSDEARFCAQCGTSLAQAGARSKPRLAPKQLLVALALGGTLWGAGFSMQKSLAGSKPTVSFEEMARRSGHTPLTESTASSAARSSGDIAALQARAGAIIEQLRTSSQPSQETVLELIDVLAQILQITPNDPDALLAMADLSFNQQVFAKAIEYYERYLHVVPDDHDVRARFGSALSFTQQYDRAIAELQKVLTAEPQDFQAAAYLAITYAQQGEREQALELGMRALEWAPEPEARARFERFLNSVRNAQSDQRSTSTSHEAAAAEHSSEIDQHPVVQHVRASTVAGPKFVRAALLGDTLQLFFREFPMESMPPFVREKFLDGIREKMPPALARVAIVDIDTANEMATVKRQ